MDSRYEEVEQHLDDYVSLLNALSWEYTPWNEPKAQKQHECEFGCLIERGSRYFRKQWSPDHREDVKLCHACMVRMLFALFGTDQEATKRGVAMSNSCRGQHRTRIRFRWQAGLGRCRCVADWVVPSGLGRAAGRNCAAVRLYTASSRRHSTGFCPNATLLLRLQGDGNERALLL